MLGFETLEQPDVARSLRTGRLALALNSGGDFATSVPVLFFGVLVPALFDLYFFRSGRVGVACLLLPVPLAALGLTYRLIKAAARNWDLIRIDAGTASRTARDVFTSAVKALGWERDRNNENFGRYFFDRYVVTALFRPDYILLNCRRQLYNSRWRWPITMTERDELVHSVSEAIASVPPNSELNPTGPRRSV